MEKKKSTHPDWALAQKRPKTELRCINGRYYLYEVTSKWDPQKKRSVKITGKLLGKITEAEGFVESEKAILKKQQLQVERIQVKEYGITAMIENLLGDSLTSLKKYFPESWQKIVCLAYGRLVHQSPLKNMSFHYAHSYLSEIFAEIDLSAKHLSYFLRDLGTSRDDIIRFMRSFKKAGDCILFDGTDIFSHFEQMELPMLSKSKFGTFDTMINLMCVFSTRQQMPVYYRLLPGNIKDISAFKICLLESGIKDAVVIIDKGFASKKNIKTLEDEELKFILPLPRNNSAIDYGKLQNGNKSQFDGYFQYEKRFIWYYSCQTEDNKQLTVYLDEELRGREERDYLNRIESKVADYSIEKFHEKQHTFGTIAILDNTGKKASEVYADYKTRGQVETMIDALKNVVDADRTYMQNSKTLEGWMFINHIALQWYYRILNLLKEHGLNKQYSPNDLLTMLSEVKKVKINQTWFDAERTKKVSEIMKKTKIVPIT